MMKAMTTPRPRDHALVLVMLANAGCFAPHAPIVIDDDETGAGSTSATDPSTGSTSHGTSSGSGSGSTSTADSSGSSTNDYGSESSSSSTGEPSCDAVDDGCPDEMYCNGTECVAPPTGAVVVAGGPFQMGCREKIDANCRPDEYPYHDVVLSSFAIDRTEVTANAYQECVEAGDCAPPSDMTPFAATCNHTSGSEPVVCVDWFSAEDYCTWRGGHLPSEAQWEKAARGTDGRLYPWGSQAPSCDLAHFYGCPGDDGPIPVGSKPMGASIYGVLDMAGNVTEWIGDWYSPSYYSESPATDPPGPDDGEMRGLRSSHFFDYAEASRTSSRTPHYDVGYPDDQNISVGFRCAYQ